MRISRGWLIGLVVLALALLVSCGQMNVRKGIRAGSIVEAPFGQGPFMVLHSKKDGTYYRGPHGISYSLPAYILGASNEGDKEYRIGAARFAKEFAASFRRQNQPEPYPAAVGGWVGVAYRIADGWVVQDACNEHQFLKSRPPISKTAGFGLSLLKQLKACS